MEYKFKKEYLKKPEWLKIRLPAGKEFKEVFETLKFYNLSTVCQEARCPNIAECWAKKSATIMILGRICTRACRFCAVETGNPGGIIDPDEPVKVAEVVNKFGLKYVVITSVDRDDLPDLGSSQYAKTVMAIKRKNPETRIEVLIPDFNCQHNFLDKIIEAKPFIIGHNLETVKRLTPYIRDRRCGYEKSLNVLKIVKEKDSGILTKSGFMLGLGETEDEIISTLQDLKDAGVNIITIGQYLQPTKRHIPVEKYYTPDEFRKYKEIGENLGIKYVLSGPLVRSSYHASEIPF
jgi:lipoic acid synthetase|uniref:Lipoyl synthase n=1 Tax=candidate division WOR-3 bacterium TaxID=2052148 RepID=A0A7V3RIR4_UNCW3